MILKFIPTQQYKKAFKKLYKKFPSLPFDYKVFEKEFSENPKLGVDLGGGFRKVRLAIRSKNKGKSGGGRVITYEMYIKDLEGVIILVDIYDKSDKDTITENEYLSVLNNFLGEREEAND
jgi:hypothetical protein